MLTRSQSKHLKLHNIVQRQDRNMEEDKQNTNRNSVESNSVESNSVESNSGEDNNNTKNNNVNAPVMNDGTTKEDATRKTDEEGDVPKITEKKQKDSKLLLITLFIIKL